MKVLHFNLELYSFTIEHMKTIYDHASTSFSVWEHIIFSSVPDKFKMVEVHLSCDGVGGGGLNQCILYHSNKC